MAKTSKVGTTSLVGYYPALIPYHASFFGGMARVLDIGGTLTPAQMYSNPTTADAEALCGDWLTTSLEIANAYNASVIVTNPNSVEEQGRFTFAVDESPKKRIPS